VDVPYWLPVALVVAGIVVVVAAYLFERRGRG
jgi:hypothetical protein